MVRLQVVQLGLERTEKWGAWTIELMEESVRVEKDSSETSTS